MITERWSQVQTPLWWNLLTLKENKTFCFLISQWNDFNKLFWYSLKVCRSTYVFLKTHYRQPFLLPYMLKVHRKPRWSVCKTTFILKWNLMVSIYYLSKKIEVFLPYSFQSEIERKEAWNKIHLESCGLNEPDFH